MRFVGMLWCLALLLSGCGPTWTSFEEKHPAPSLFQASLPAPWYRPGLVPLDASPRPAHGEAPATR